MLRFYSIVMLFVLSLTPIAKGKMTKHFHPGKLQVSLPQREEWEVKTEVPAALQQQFRFLANGSQSYVFESEDGQIVLKLFRYNRSRFGWIHEVKGWLHGTRKADLRTKLDKTLGAYALAMQEVPEGTGLVYVHLNPTQGLLPQIKVKDPLGRKWTMALDHYRFVVQRKAEPLKEVFLRAQGQEEEVRRLFDSLVAVLQTRVQKGIRNSDHNLGPNFGVIAGKVVEIDCGNFHLDEALSDPENQKQEIRRFTGQLGGWVRAILLSRLDVNLDRL